MGRFDVVTLFVALALGCVLAMVACTRVSRPRHDAWQPEELSGCLGPPFPSPTNGVRKI